MKKKKDSIDALLEFYEEHMPETIYLIRNPERYDKAKAAMEEIKAFISSIEDSATFKVEKDELIGTGVWIEVKCSLLTITEVDKFCSVIKTVDSIDIAPTTDGNISMVLGFNDVYMPAPPRS